MKSKNLILPGFLFAGKHTCEGFEQQQEQVKFKQEEKS